MITQDLPVLTYTVRELAASAKVSETKIWMEIADGELETILVGDRRLITPQQAERWLERKAARARRFASSAPRSATSTWSPIRFHRAGISQAFQLVKPF